MTQMLELPDKDFKEAIIIKMAPVSNYRLETSEEIESLSKEIQTKNPFGICPIPGPKP